MSYELFTSLSGSGTGALYFIIFDYLLFLITMQSKTTLSWRQERVVVIPSVWNLFFCFRRGEWNFI